MTDRSSDDILTPDDLSIAGDEAVVQLNDGRYLIATDDSPSADGDAEETSALPSLPTEETYAVSVLARLDTDEPATYAIGSDDVTQPVEGFLRWYAEQVAPERPAEEVVAVLLSHTPFATET